MQIEVALLILESTLLAITVLLLLYSIREGRQRSRMMLEVARATRTLTRLEYFQMVGDAIAAAEVEVIGCVTGHRQKGAEDLRRVNHLLVLIEKAVGRRVKVHYLLPKFHDRLYMGYFYTRAGAEVRYTTNAEVYSVRYSVVDSNLVVVGIPEAIGDEAPTNKGHLLPSEVLAGVIRSHFYDCWAQSQPFEDYLREVMAQTGTSVERLAAETRLEKGKLEELLARLDHP